MHRPTTSMMKTEEKIKAVRNRDANYRGKFFVAVRTTKIVCTPDCPAKPLEKNIVFYDTLEEALQVGYRPCKICMKEFHNNKRNNMETIKITSERKVRRRNSIAHRAICLVGFLYRRQAVTIFAIGRWRNGEVR